MGILQSGALLLHGHPDIAQTQEVLSAKYPVFWQELPYQIPHKKRLDLLPSLGYGKEDPMILFRQCFRALFRLIWTIVRLQCKVVAVVMLVLSSLLDESQGRSIGLLGTDRTAFQPSGGCAFPWS